MFARTHARRALLLAATTLGLTLGAAPAWAQTIRYVDASATGANNGLNWDDAYVSLQSALTNTAASFRAHYFVAEGTYHPGAPVTPGTNRDATFLLTDGEELFGGWLGTELGTDPEIHRQGSAANTILSGDIFLDEDPSHFAHHVVSVTISGGGPVGTLATVAIDGVKIQEGNAKTIAGTSPAAALEHGGGILYLAQTEAKATLEIRGSIITDNNAKQHGGGIFAGGFGGEAQEGLDEDGVLFIPGGTLDIVDSHILKNSARETGGGVRTDYLSTGARAGNNSANSHTWNTLIAGNVAALGGGIFAGTPTDLGQAAQPRQQYYNCVVVDNTAEVGGGLATGYYAPFDFMNSTVVGNAATEDGGGLFIGAGAGYFEVNTRIGNNIIHGNTALGEEDELYSEFQTNPLCVHAPTVIANNLLRASVIATSASCSGHVLSGNITGNPKFVNPALGDYHLLGTSPAIDAGVQTYQLPDWFDLDGNTDPLEPTPLDYDLDPRSVGNAIDMGAFEYQP